MKFTLRQLERKMLANGEMLLPDFNLAFTPYKVAAVKRLAKMGLVELGNEVGNSLQFRTLPHDTIVEAYKPTIYIPKKGGE